MYCMAGCSLFLAGGPNWLPFPCNRMAPGRIDRGAWKFVRGAKTATSVGLSRETCAAAKCSYAPRVFMTMPPPPFYRFRPHPWHGLDAGHNAPNVVTAYIEIT